MEHHDARYYQLSFHAQHSLIFVHSQRRLGERNIRHLLYDNYDASASLRRKSPSSTPVLALGRQFLLTSPQFMMTRIYSTLLTDNRSSLPEDYHSHYLHCVDYLRQGIMCSADLTMEPHGPGDADDNGPLDGSWNGHHGKSPNFASKTTLHASLFLRGYYGLLLML
jgi:hypothetical protein